MNINWKNAQTRLAAAGLAPGPADGVLGSSTMTALLAHAAHRQPDGAIRAMAVEAVRTLPRHGITDTPERMAEFLAETTHESGGYTRFDESLRYSAKRLMAVWPKRFPTLASALPYAWDPTDPDREDVALANLVYGARMGNDANGTDDNDGWDHRGRGILQHTGAEEYRILRQDLGFEPDDVADPAKAVVAAADYWTRRGLNKLADRGDFTGLRRAINGGTIGLGEVAVARARELAILW